MASNGLRFMDKVAIVTGGCKGIGKGCVDVFVENGGKVVIFDIDETTGKGLVGKCGQGEIHFISCDTTKEEQIKAAVSETVEKYSKIDCLVNNAGWQNIIRVPIILHSDETSRHAASHLDPNCFATVITNSLIARNPPFRTIDEETVEEFNNLFQLNVTGYFMCCKYALPHLRKTKGSVVNISSEAKNGQKRKVAYAATKGAVSSMTYALALDEGKNGVRVNAICPGVIRTPLLKSVMEGGLDETKANVFGRIGDPREIGQACLFLAVEATYTTGTDLWCSAASERGGWI